MFLKKLKIFALLLIFGVLISDVLAQKFTIPIFPDTQEEITRKRGMFFAQIEWIESKADSLKVPIVFHVGDLVNYDNFDQWELASVGMKILDRANIPYAIALGNHDTGAVGEYSGSAAPGNVNANLRKTHKFNHYFPVNRFPLQKGRFEKNKSDNSYYIFEAGGLRWLVVTLEFCARDTAAKWMDATLKKYPDHNAIILTHFHLNSKGEIQTNNAGYGDMAINSIFEKYIQPNKNVVLVLSGHVGTSAWRVDQGSHGNSIYQILQDYQGKDNGGGYLRLLDIDTSQGTFEAKMYSPFYNKVLDDNSKFKISGVSFIR